MPIERMPIPNVEHGIRVGSLSPGPVISALLTDRPEEKRFDL